MVVKVDDDEREGVMEGLMTTAGVVLRFLRSCSLISSAAKASSFSPFVRSDNFRPRNSTDSTPLSVSEDSAAAAGALAVAPYP